MDATIVPEKAFLRYRYTALSVAVVASIAGVAWMIPLAPSEHQGVAVALVALWVGLIAVLALAAALWYPIHTRTLRYTLQADRIVAEQGVWFRVRKFVPYVRITDVTVAQGPLERRFRIHRLAVQTAGSPMPEAVLVGIGDPETVRAALLERKAATREGTTDGGSTSIELLAGIRDELTEIRRLLDTRPGV